MDLVQAFGQAPEKYIFDTLKTEFHLTGKPQWDRDRLIIWLDEHRSTEGVQETLNRLLKNNYLEVEFATRAKGNQFRKLALSFHKPGDVSPTTISAELPQNSIESPNVLGQEAPVEPTPLETLTIPALMATHYIPRNLLTVGALFETYNERKYVITLVDGDQITIKAASGDINIHDFHIVHINILKLFYKNGFIREGDPHHTFYTDADLKERLLTLTTDGQWGAFESETQDGGFKIFVKRVPPILHWETIETLDNPYLVFHNLVPPNKFLFTAYSVDGTPWFNGVCDGARSTMSTVVVPPLKLKEAVEYWRLMRQALLVMDAVKGES